MKGSKNSIRVEIGEIENTCFVVMPFDSLFQTQYERVIRPAIEELGLRCIRGDEIYSKPQIMADIWKSIRRSRLVIAELTNRNANVFYEVGLAHAIGKPIILLTRNEDDVPFDLKSLRYRFYNVNDPFWGENLRSAIQSMVQSVLEQPEIPLYLEGISAELVFPEPPERETLPAERLLPVQDVSGSWKVEMKGETISPHQGTVFITQHDEELSATLTVTFERDGNMTVIQEILTGRIQGTKITLNGVSYTYIHQGNAKNYFLDNFDLTLSPDKQRMEGECALSKGSASAVFIKQEGISG